MNIGQAAKASGLPAKTIRYYEDIGLVTPDRQTNGFRDFSNSDVHKLQFLARSRDLGFSIEDCRALLELYENQNRASGEVRKIAKRHLTQIDEKIAGLSVMRDTLTHLVANCAGDLRPDCPILADLAGPVSPE